jgi:hypothetical protein
MVSPACLHRRVVTVLPTRFNEFQVGRLLTPANR